MEASHKKKMTFGEKKYTLDKYGFLDPPEQWDENFADGMARLQGIYEGLTGEHWSFIDYIRKKFYDEKTLPLLVNACTDNDMRLKKLRSLFPTGYFRGACRIAGLSYKAISDENLWHTYETPPILKKEFKVTSLGFLEDFDSWNERFAHIASSEWNLPEGLTPKHWEIIHFLRNYYLAANNIPTVFEVCQAYNLESGDLKDLFPEGYRRGACRIAGLPFFG